jgi:hypothetical protein
VLGRRIKENAMKWAPCLVLLAALGCGASTTLNTTFETPGTVAGRSTYAFTDATGLTGDGFTTGHLFNPIMQRRVKDEVGKELSKKGYQPGEADSASMLIAFTTGNREDVVTQGDQQGTTVRGPAYTVQRGALFLHFIDPQTQQVIWRGWAEGVISMEDDIDAKVREAVRLILAPFPAAAAS